MSDGPFAGMSPADLRAEWKAARSAVQKTEAKRELAILPFKEEYEVRLERLEAIESVIGEQVGPCEGCGEPIFEDEPYNVGVDGNLCRQCAPTYRDIRDNPGSFYDHGEGPMTGEQAAEVVRAHLAKGGLLDDPILHFLPDEKPKSEEA